MTAKDLIDLLSKIPPDTLIPTKEMIYEGNIGIDDAIDFYNYDSGAGYSVEPHAAKDCWDRMIKALKGV